MSWSTPRTWVTGEVVSASIMNTHVRDQFNEMPNAKISALSQYFVANGTSPPSIGVRSASSDVVLTEETTTSTSYTNLSTSGPAVSKTTGTTALVIVSCQSDNNTAGEDTRMSFAISGATTVSASDAYARIFTSSGADEVGAGSWAYIVSSLTAGTNVFTAKYSVSGGTGSFRRRYITVMPF